MHASQKHDRRSVRLKDTNYADACRYFITLGTFAGASLFAELTADQLYLNPFGKIVEEHWLHTPAICPEIILDEYVITPNHLHGIIFIAEANTGGAADKPPSIAVGAHGRAPLHTPHKALSRPPRSLGSFVAGFKSIVTKRINTLCSTPGMPVGLINYFEPIVRDDQDLHRIREYIRNNPLQWQLEHEFPEP